MRRLIYGAAPIGRWLALRLALAGKDVTLLDHVPRLSRAAERERVAS